MNKSTQERHGTGGQIYCCGKFSVQHLQRGFSLFEMVVVIMIIAVIGGMVAIFINAPVQGYVDSARRADMTDIADTAMRRMTHDIRQALPNSVRVTNNGATVYLEYLETIAGGRYNSATTPANCLTSGSCTALTTVGDLINGTPGSASSVLANGQGTIGASAVVVVYNQSNTCPSAYCGDNAPVITSVTNGATNANEDVIAFSPTTFSTGGSPNNRFQIVNTPVSYVCNPAAGTLTRYWGYAIQAAQPNDVAAAPFLTAYHALLASNISSCSFAYSFVQETLGVAQSSVLVTMPLTIAESGVGGQVESISLYSAAHASNELGLYGAAHVSNVP